MKGILSDVNIQGQVDGLVVRFKAEPWKVFWDELGLQYYRFADVGLIPESSDLVIWETCQREGLVLITENRNDDGPDSLQTTIRTRNNVNALPVFTIANVPQLRASREYGDRVIDKALDFLDRIDSLRGTGRLYLP